MVVLDHLKPEDSVTVSRNAARTPSVSPHLIPFQKLTVGDLLYLALMRSINGAAVALAEAVSGSEGNFAELMNAKADEVGAFNTKFINATGLPGYGQYITAYDLAKIMKASLSYPVIKQIINTREKVVVAGGKSFFLKNTNRMLWEDECYIGGKTGYTRAAHHCLAFAATKGDNTLIAALLGESARDSLWITASELLYTSYEIAKGTAEPEIYTSNETPVLLASYDISKSARSKGLRRGRHHHHKSAKALTASNVKKSSGKHKRLVAKRRTARKRHLVSQKTTAGSES